MRRARRTDANQTAVVLCLRAAGCSVEIISDVGRGVPDLLVGFRAKTFLLEVKNPDLPPSKQQLTPDEKRWHAEWRGHVAVVTSPQEAINVVTRGYP